ncbi:hypothetical protein GBAR_LOCUS29930 [Geodia barretti]|uniref:Fibronectin type-III domain-containing protein n=1 Tax=Geodia barretti TaxID=519541 RepID=A0AA35XKV6_GEOBA|nr:hypothetical protein GBAR_LOCUS29930 [Geodia barretti]
MSWEGSSSTTITIKWGPVPCADRNGNITSYVVMFRENGTEMFHNETTTGVIWSSLSLVTTTEASPPTTADTREGGSNVGGVVAGVIVSVLFLIGATLGIIAAIWLMRRKKSTMKGLFSMGHFKVTRKQAPCHTLEIHKTFLWTSFPLERVWQVESYPLRKMKSKHTFSLTLTVPHNSQLQYKLYPTSPI